jgi:hypothetical protein
MPNWTANTVEVTGIPKDIRKFQKHMGEGFSFEKIIPPPADMFRGDLGTKERQQCADEGIPNWEEWQSENWDTKWDACRVEVEEQEFGGLIPLTMVIYRFDTAGSPPEKVIARLRQDWPEFEITGGYVGEGYEFCGPF